MRDSGNRITDLIRNPGLLHEVLPAQPSRTTFLEWSRRPDRLPFIPKVDRRNTLGITTRLMATIYPWRAVNLQVGEPFAQITTNVALIRFPEPFDDNGLTDACRTFIIDAVRQAIERDGLHRSITWPENWSADQGGAE